MGIGIGAKNATVPIYSAEMAPAPIRGALVMFWQLWVVIGKSLLNLSFSGVPLRLDLFNIVPFLPSLQAGVSY